MTITRTFGRPAYRTGPSYPQIRKLAARHKTQIALLNVSEKDFLAHVCTLAALYGWHGIHIIASKGVMEGVHSLSRAFPRRADHDDALGFPDLVLVHPARRLGIFAELKTRRGRTTADQDHWLEWWSDLGSVRSFVWRPDDEPDIVRTLRDGWAV